MVVGCSPVTLESDFLTSGLALSHSQSPLGKHTEHHLKSAVD